MLGFEKKKKAAEGDHPLWKAALLWTIVFGSNVVVRKKTQKQANNQMVITINKKRQYLHSNIKKKTSPSFENKGKKWQSSDGWIVVSV